MNVHDVLRYLVRHTVSHDAQTTYDLLETIDSEEQGYESLEAFRAEQARQEAQRRLSEQQAADQAAGVLDPRDTRIAELEAQIRSASEQQLAAQASAAQTARIAELEAQLAAKPAYPLPPPAFQPSPPQPTVASVPASSETPAAPA